MAENRMQIVLDMVDNASAEFKRVNADAIREVKTLENQSSTSHKKMQTHTEKTTSGLSKFSASIRNARLQLFGLTVVMAIAVKGLNDAAQYNEEAKATSDAFNKSLKGLSATLGHTFAPAIEGLTVLIDNFRVVIEAALGGFIKLFSFTFEFLAQLPQAFGNVIANIKAVFTGDDPIGVVEGFQQSFARAVEVANIATDQILQKYAETRARIETGQTLGKDKTDVEEQQKRQTKAVEQGTKIRNALAQSEVQVQVAALGAVAEMTTLFGQESKAAFYILKAIKAAEIMVNSAAADMSIMSAWAWNPPVAASLIAQNKVLTAISLATVAAAAVAGSFAVGSPNIPNDMLAQVHKGETIIPATFAESIRRGDLSLSGGGGGSFGDVNIFIQGGINPGGASVEEMAEQLGFAFERETRMARGF